MSMCAMCMLNDAANAKRMRTVVLSAHMLWFFGIEMYVRYHFVPSR